MDSVGDGVLQRKRCGVGHNGQVFMRAQRRDNPRVYQDGNKAYP
jgi:hypothetical protein